MAGSKAAERRERGCDSNYEAASQALIKREQRGGGPGCAPPENLGGRTGGPGPRSGPARPRPTGKNGGGGKGGGVAAKQTLGARPGALAPRGPGTQRPSPMGP